jgi:DNA-binding NtrC family response regulator
MFESRRSRVIIGSDSGCDVTLADDTVSARHCEVGARDGRFFVRDLGSTNGTRVNRTEVVEAVLEPGSTLALGECMLRFEPETDLVPVDASARERFGNVIGRSRVMRELFGLLERIAPTDLTCVLLGETGTGKEELARSIHAASRRASAPFVVLDCGAVSETLIESELFGHERGAFTGADRARAGAFESAHGGTLFLDEVGELPLALQPKLLRVLEAREVRRLGGDRARSFDVRVVAATHRDLPAMVEAGELREDLFFRLAEVLVPIPPLRERLEDVPVLVDALLERSSATASVDDEVMRRLQRRAYPGNVRDLRNLLRRATALADAGRLDVAALEAAERLGAARPVARDGAEGSVGDHLPLREARQEWVRAHERAYLQKLLQRFDGDTHAAAEHAEVHRKSLLRLLNQHGIDHPRGR